MQCFLAHYSPMQTLVFDASQPLHPQIAKRVIAHAAHSHHSALANTLLIVPNDFLVHPLRQAFLEANCLFLPTMLTLPQLCQRLQPSKNTTANYTVLAAHQCQLLLTELLQQHPDLYGKGSPWGLSSNLLRLFDELTNHNLTHEDLRTTFANAPIKNTWQQHEQTMVLTLWQAWLEQMRAEGWRDAANHHAQSLLACDFSLLFEDHIYYLQPSHSTVCEQAWLGRLQTHFEQNQASTQKTLFVAEYDAPLQPNKPLPSIDLTGCTEQEQQALVIAERAKANAEQGEYTAIVCEDRQMARRVQAILQRWGIELDDKSGWALSTTQVGAALNHWLDCIDTQFNHQPLMDCLRSDFILPEWQNKSKLAHTLAVEYIHKRNLSGGLTIFKRALQQDINKHDPLSVDTLENADGSTSDSNNHRASSNHALLALIDTLQEAAQPLFELQKGQHTITQYIEAFEHSLEALRMFDALQEDDAGLLILQLFDDLKSMLSSHAQRLKWVDFRACVHQALESHYFRPKIHRARVSLLTLNQCSWMDADALIIGAANAENIPPKPPASPFFTPSLRQQLGLPSIQSMNERHANVFNRILASHSKQPSATQTPSTDAKTLITWQTQQDGAPAALSPWVSMWQLNRPHAFNQRDELGKQAMNTLHATLSESPYTKATGEGAHTLYTGQFSAGAHQRLINCPYEFFVQDLLRLQPLNSLQLALEKSDFGSFAHAALHAFFIDVHNLPGPFNRTLSADNLHEAQTLLEAISHALFKHALSQRFEHQSWLERWLALIPEYLQWELTQQTQWHAKQFESNIDVQIHNDALGLSIHGRIDRVDINKSNQQLSILDYKTGKPPSAEDMLTGEDVQLSSYALALMHNTANQTTHQSAPIAQIQYVPIDKRINNKHRLDNETLNELLPKIKARLLSIHQAIQAQHPLPTWGQSASAPSPYQYHTRIAREALWKND